MSTNETPYDKQRAADRAALTYDDPYTLGRLVRSLSKFGMIAGEDVELTRDDAIREWSIATLRAVAIAAHQGQPDEHSLADLKFDGADVAVVLTGVIAVLKDGHDLARLISEHEEAVP